MTRIVLRHLSGSKSQQVEEFPLEKARDLMIGRDSSAHIRFDPDRDDLVGRQHARLLQDPADPFKFSLVDLNSRNGTFVNRQRVIGTAVLTPGDVVQLGAGGPEFRFEIDPLPEHLVKATRLVAMQTAMAQPTREAAVSTVATSANVGVGKATVERIVHHANAQLRRKVGVALAAALLLAVFTWSGTAWWDARKPMCDQPGESGCKPMPKLTPAGLAAAYSSSTVLVEFAWKLVFTGTGEQLYQEYALQTDRHGKQAVDKQGHPLPPMPIFERSNDGRISPKLTTDRGSANQNTAIACGGSGSGFAVSTDGFILTNRHVGANWEASYGCFPDSGPALLVIEGQKQPQVVPDIRVLNLDWIPARDGRRVSGKDFEGQNIYLDVTFRLNKLRIPATVARVSDRADVTLLKINTPQPIKKVEMRDTYETIAVGDQVTVMGYPGVSPKTLVSTPSMAPGPSEGRVVVVPDTTVTPGTVGRILRGQMKALQGGQGDYNSGFGDTYQLTVNATGHGNSGGPVFDDYGRVIGLYTYGRSDAAGTTISFAVPIRYGLELMGTSPAVTR